MSRAESTASSPAMLARALRGRTLRKHRRSSGEVSHGVQGKGKTRTFLKSLAFGTVLLLTVFVPGRVAAQTDCLTCHADKGLQDAAGHNISVDGDSFGQSIHGALGCNACHSDISGYPHPDKVARVNCDTCHASQASDLAGSVHSNAAEHPCTSCHGDAHSIFPKG